MKKIALGIFIGLSLVSIPGNAAADDRLTLNFNPGWKFIKADETGAPSPQFNDSGWTTVSTPHTYNDTDTFDNLALPGLRGETNQWGGRTWYRKTFNVPAEWQGKKVYIEFEAVRQVADVYLNGHYLGTCKNGFIPFGFDLTPFIQVGRPNVLAVMCDNRFAFNPMKAETNGAGGGGKRRGGRAAADASEAGDDAADVPDKKPAEAAAATTTTNGGTSIENLQARLAKEAAAIPTNVYELQAGQIPWNNPQWHPAMGGIYRNVKLYVIDPVHLSLPLYDFLQTEGPYVYATDISERSATVSFEVPIQNDGAVPAQIEFNVQVLDRDRRPLLTIKPVLKAGLALGPGMRTKYKVSTVLNSPQLWQPDYPYLYHAVITVVKNGQPADSVDVPFGIRAVHWDVRTGFTINGNHLKLHGWGQKPIDEWPGLGDAMPDWMHYYTLQLMKDAGGNWVRWGHCAGGPAQIETCDQLGLMVEQPGVDGEADTVRAAWRVRADAFRDLIIYYRNHPSILIWEGGNQKVTSAHAQELRELVTRFDPRGGRAYAHRRADKTTGEFMDVTIGTEGSHEVPRLPVVEGEYDREESPRRVWDTNSPPNEDYVRTHKGQTYTLTSEQFAINEVRQYYRKVSSASHSGGANWIFTDSTSGGRNTTEVDRASGEVDGVRLPKEAYYACQVMFQEKPGVHILGHWNYPSGTRKSINVVSTCQDVELFLNGRSLGHGRNSNRYLFTFDNVGFESGELKAVGSNGGAPIASHTLHTAGEPVALRITPMVGPSGFLANGSDIALFDVEAVDAAGQRCPLYQQRADFTCTGPGTWRGGYNSGKTNSVNNTYLDLEAGINRVAVRSTLEAGTVTLTARSGNLKAATVTVTSQPFTVENGASATLPAVPRPQWLASHQPWANLTRAVPPMTTTALAGADAMVGRYTYSFSYTGPTDGARVRTNAVDGARVYADSSATFSDLPPELVGADWVQTINADSLYSAVDLMQLVVQEKMDMYLAHDDRASTPEWLTNQFKAATNLSDDTITVNDMPMRLYRHNFKEEGSITLGSNTDDASVKEANAYVIFIAPQREKPMKPVAPAGDEDADTTAPAAPAATTNNPVVAPKPAAAPAAGPSAAPAVIAPKPPATAVPAAAAPKPAVAPVPAAPRPAMATTNVAPRPRIIDEDEKVE